MTKFHNGYSMHMSRIEVIIYAFQLISVLVHLPRSFFNELVINIVTSLFSSKSSIDPKYPIRLSVNRGDTTNFMTSICPK